MKTSILIYAALLSLGGAHPACASPGILPASPVDEVETPSLNEPPPKPVMPPASPRGQLLYENHCMSCHESSVHVRARTHAKSLPELRAWVLRWKEYLQLRWGREEVDDVVNHLNSQYYKFESR